MFDFPKIHCPFIRKLYDVNLADWKEHGSKLQLRTPKVQLIINEINSGYEWVFNDPYTIAVEKLDGTNIKLLTKDNLLIEVQNRKNIINPLKIIGGKLFIIEGILRSVQKGYVEDNKEQAGELIGPKLQGNPYKLEYHEWYPFEKAIKHLSYRSFHEHDRTFDNWNIWFKDYLVSRFHGKKKKLKDEKVMAEGIVFYNLKRKSKGLKYMAKLRRDMFNWYYSDKIEIFNYSKEG